MYCHHLVNIQQTLHPLTAFWHREGNTGKDTQFRAPNHSWATTSSPVTTWQHIVTKVLMTTAIYCSPRRLCSRNSLLTADSETWLRLRCTFCSLATPPTSVNHLYSRSRLSVCVCDWHVFPAAGKPMQCSFSSAGLLYPRCHSARLICS